MPTANGFNTGKDILLIISTPTGVLTVSGITGFQSMQVTASLDSKLIDGTNLYDEIPVGWTLSFDLERLDSTLDDYFAQAEAAYYNNGSTASPITVQETINENNGGITQYRYQGVALKFDDAGTWRGDQKVSQKFSGRCGRRVKVQ